MSVQVCPIERSRQRNIPIKLKLMKLIPVGDVFVSSSTGHSMSMTTFMPKWGCVSMQIAQVLQQFYCTVNSCKHKGDRDWVKKSINVKAKSLNILIACQHMIEWQVWRNGLCIQRQFNLLYIVPIYALLAFSAVTFNLIKIVIKLLGAFQVFINWLAE